MNKRQGAGFQTDSPLLLGAQLVKPDSALFYLPYGIWGASGLIFILVSTLAELSSHAWAHGCPHALYWYHSCRPNHPQSLQGGVALATSSCTLVGLHGVLGVGVGAFISAVHTGVYLLSQSQCAHAQSSFTGCSACACAVTNACTRDQLASAVACGSCLAPSVDFCSDLSRMQAVFICVVSSRNKLDHQ